LAHIDNAIIANRHSLGTGQGRVSSKNVGIGEDDVSGLGHKMNLVGVVLG
jgi:hypothetical protein